MTTTIISAAPPADQHLASISARAVFAVLMFHTERNPYRRASDTYVYDGKPNCIVARTLHDLGIPLTTLAELDTLHATIGSTDAARVVPNLTPIARQLLAAAQHTQDLGSTWAAAGVAATATAKRHGVI